MSEAETMSGRLAELVAISGKRLCLSVVMTRLPDHQCDCRYGRGYGEGPTQAVGTRCFQNCHGFESICILKSINVRMCRKIDSHRVRAVNAGNDTSPFTLTSPVSSSYGSLLRQAAPDCRALLFFHG